MVVSPGAIIASALAASLLGWALLAVLERITAVRARRAWVTTAVVVLLLSLLGPLTASEIDAGARASLLTIHLVVGAVLIPLYARSSADNADARPRRWHRPAWAGVAGMAWRGIRVVLPGAPTRPETAHRQRHRRCCSLATSREAGSAAREPELFFTTAAGDGWPMVMRATPASGQGTNPSDKGRTQWPSQTWA